MNVCETAQSRGVFVGEPPLPGSSPFLGYVAANDRQRIVCCGWRWWFVVLRCVLRVAVFVGVAVGFHTLLTTITFNLNHTMFWGAFWWVRQSLMTAPLPPPQLSRVFSICSFTCAMCDAYVMNAIYICFAFLCAGRDNNRSTIGSITTQTTKLHRHIASIHLKRVV